MCWSEGAHNPEAIKKIINLIVAKFIFHGKIKQRVKDKNVLISLIHLLI